jgi:hypothetical protein
VRTIRPRQPVSNRKRILSIDSWRIYRNRDRADGIAARASSFEDRDALRLPGRHEGCSVADVAPAAGLPEELTVTIGKRTIKRTGWLKRQ